jgi:rRNA maturation protein Nop10
MNLFKNVTIFEVLTFILALAALIMVAVMLSKVKKCCKNENYTIKDVGPVASDKKTSLPSNSQFSTACQNAFQNQCNSSSNVCGDDSGNVVCQDFTDMDDQSCYER